MRRFVLAQRVGEAFLSGGAGSPDQDDEQPLGTRKRPPHFGKHQAGHYRDSGLYRHALVPAGYEKKRRQNMTDDNQGRPGRHVKRSTLDAARIMGAVSPHIRRAASVRPVTMQGKT